VNKIKGTMGLQVMQLMTMKQTGGTAIIQIIAKNL